MIFLIIISIIPNLGIIIYTGSELRQEKISNIQDTALGALNTIANHQQVITESSRQLLITLSKMPEVQKLDYRSCNALFKELLPQNPMYANILLADKNGVVISTALTAGFTNVKSRKYFRDAIVNRGFSAGEYAVGLIVKSSVFHFAYPVMDKKGKVKAVIALALNLKRYDAIIPEAKLPEYSVLAFSDHKGNRLYRYPENEKYAGKPDLPEMMRKMSGANDEGSFMGEGVDGTKRFYAFKRLRLTKDAPPYLYMRLGIPEDHVLSEARAFLYRNLAMLGIVFILVLVTTWYMGSRLIVNPISKLVAVTRRFRQGDRQVRVGLPSSNIEINHLAAALDEMITEVNNQEGEQRKIAESLRESEEQYRHLEKYAPSGIYEVDFRENRFIRVNDMMCKYSGYTREELLNMNPYDVLTDESKDLFIERLKKSLSGEEISDSVLYSLYKKDGQKIWVILTNRFITNAEGAAVGSHVVIHDISELKEAERERDESFQRLHLSFENIIQAVIMALEARDSYTAGHQRRVANLARSIAEEMGCSPRIIDNVRMAGLIHDIGKISIPVEILSKPTKLASLEYELIKTHALNGYLILKDIDFEGPLAEIVLQHHERLDGSGYPRNLRGEDILLESRIIAVADVVEATASYRPYRPAHGIEVAMEEIRTNRGILYDNIVVDACLRLFQEKKFRLEI